MSFLKWVYICLKKIYNKSKTVITLAGYNEETICQYFRKKGANIGEDCVISTKSLGSEPYLVSIGNNVWISSGVDFHTHDGGVHPLRKKYPELHVFGPIVIEDNCIIGRNAQILPNTHIGKNSIVGAGSVVISDVPADTVVMGVPARPVGSVSKYEKRCVDLWEMQKPPEIDASNHSFDSKKNREILRKHLIEIYMNQKENKDTPQ